MIASMANHHDEHGTTVEAWKHFDEYEFKKNLATHTASSTNGKTLKPRRGIPSRFRFAEKLNRNGPGPIGHPKRDRKAEKKRKKNGGKKR